MTCCDPQLGDVVTLPDKELRHNSSPEQEPYNQARPHRQCFRSKSPVHEWFDHSQVAVQADARDGLSWAVNITVKQSRNQPAGGFPKYPVVPIEVVVNTQRKGKQEQQVRQRQVQVKNDCGKGLCSEPDSEKGQNVAVGGDAHQHRQDVRWGYDPGAEHPCGIGCHWILWLHMQVSACVIIVGLKGPWIHCVRLDFGPVFVSCKE